MLEQELEEVLMLLNRLADHIGRARDGLKDRPLSSTSHDYVDKQMEGARDTCMAAGEAVGRLAQAIAFRCRR